MHCVDIGESFQRFNFRTGPQLRDEFRDAAPKPIGRQYDGVVNERAAWRQAERRCVPRSQKADQLERVWVIGGTCARPESQMYRPESRLYRGCN